MTQRIKVYVILVVAAIVGFGGRTAVDAQIIEGLLATGAEEVTREFERCLGSGCTWSQDAANGINDFVGGTTFQPRQRRQAPGSFYIENRTPIPVRISVESPTASLTPITLAPHWGQGFSGQGETWLFNVYIPLADGRTLGYLVNSGQRVYVAPDAYGWPNLYASTLR